MHCTFKASYFHRISVLASEQTLMNVKMNVIEMNFAFIFTEEKNMEGSVNNDKNDEDKLDEDEDSFIMSMPVLDDLPPIPQASTAPKSINKGNVSTRKRKTEAKEATKASTSSKRRPISKATPLNSDLFKAKSKVKVKSGKTPARSKR